MEKSSSPALATQRTNQCYFARDFGSDIHAIKTGCPKRANASDGDNSWDYQDEPTPLR
ncbi:hypothetical protein [Paraburkholderia fungorum]